MTTQPQKKKNLLLEAMLTVLIPVFLLNYGTKHASPAMATSILVFALMIPLSYSIWEFRREKTVNILATIGILKILTTGGLGLYKAPGFMMVLNETLFPLCLGIYFFSTSFTSTPVIKGLLLNDQFLEMEKLETALEKNNLRNAFLTHLKRSTQLFSLSTFIAAFLNYYYAVKIFVPINPSLPSDEIAQILNEQIARMTAAGYVGIMIPSSLILVVAAWYFFRGVNKLTGLRFNELMKQS
jgi:hypothetical protein